MSIKFTRYDYKYSLCMTNTIVKLYCPTAYGVSIAKLCMHVRQYHVILPFLHIIVTICNFDFVIVKNRVRNDIHCYLHSIVASCIVHCSQIT